MFDFRRELAELRRQLLLEVEQRFANLIGWTYTAHSSEVGDADDVELADGQKGQRPALGLEQWGIRGRAPSKIRSLWLRIGSSNVVKIGLSVGKGYGPSDLNEGETELYNSITGVSIKLAKDGSVTLTDKAGAKVLLDGSANVVVNNGTLKVARDTDPTNMGQWSVQLATVSGTVCIVGITIQQPDGSTVNLNTTPHSLAGAINGGAANFKG